MSVSEGLMKSGQKYLSVRIVSPFTPGAASGLCVDGCPGNEVSTSNARSSKNPLRSILQDWDGGHNAEVRAVSLDCCCIREEVGCSCVRLDDVCLLEGGNCTLPSIPASMVG